MLKFNPTTGRFDLVRSATVETDPIFNAWNRSDGISITESQISDLQTYLLTETDPVAMAYLNQAVKTTSSPTFVKATFSQATGTAPFTVSSTTKVSNLNAEQVDGYDFDQLVKTTSSPTFVDLTLTGKITATQGSAMNVFGGNGIAAPVPTNANDIFVMTKSNADTNFHRGVLAKAEYTGTGTGATQMGLNGFGQNTSTGTVALALGGRYGGRNTAGGTITDMRGVDTLIQNTSTGEITTGTAFYATIPTNTGGGTFKNWNGLLVQACTVGSVSNRGINLAGDSSLADAINCGSAIVFGAGNDSALAYDGTDTVLANLVGTGAFNAKMDIKISTVGNGLYVKEGTNATMGIATLVAGTVVVNTTKVTANSRIFLTVNGGTLTNVGATYISARTAGTSFTITSMNILDTSNVAWFIVEPA